MPASDIKDPELRLHAMAYMDIFRHILKKYPDGHPQKEAVLSRLSDYLEKNIKKTEDFIDHIPVFSKALGVAPGPLGAFIGAQFSRALSSVRKKAQKEPSLARQQDAAGHDAAVQQKSAQKQYATIMDEIADLYSLKSPGRFKGGELGVLILTKPDGTVITSGSAAAGELQKTEATAVQSQIQKVSDSASSVSVPAAASAPVSVTGKSQPVFEDKPLIADILEKLGSVLNVHEKLVFNPMPQEATSVEVLQTEEPSRPEKQPAAEATAQSALTRSSSQPYKLPADAPVIADILEKIGPALRVTEKLVPVTGIEENQSGSFSGMANAADEAGNELQSNAVQLGEGPEPIAFHYEDYIEILRNLQSFHAKGDRSEYEQWLKSDGNETAGIFVNLRNRESREKKGELLNWDVEYFNISLDYDYSKEQIRLFHQTMKKYDRIQRLFAHLSERIKGAHPRILNEMKKIWPQIRMLPGNGDNYNSYVSQLKIILLQVQDQPVKAKLLEIMDPYLRKAAEIMQG